MSARPVLFNGAMVRAILAGAKTQTRRLVKPPTRRQAQWLKPSMLNMSPRAEIVNGGAQFDHPAGGPLTWVRGPIAPGDDLWVRETWNPREDVDPSVNAEKARHYCHYAATYIGDLRDEWHSYGKWRPSIHMPRWASRLTLRVTSVRVERLHDITEDDARAEGVLTLEPRAGAASARERFADLWSEVYGRESWDANPWVWRVEFWRRDDGGAT